MDKDTVGVLNTIHFWKEKHPDTTFLGINENEDERDTIRIVEKDGIKIASTTPMDSTASHSLLISLIL